MIDTAPMRVEADFLVGLLRPCDAAIVDVFRLGERWTGTVLHMPLVPQSYSTEAALFPVLVDFKKLTTDQSNELLETMRQEHLRGADLSAQTLFNTDADSDTLRTHWINHLVVTMPGPIKTLLRSYDPRVFLQLRRILNPRQLKSLFGPITTWTIYWQGRWLSFDAPQAVAGLLQPTAAQASQIERIGAINEVLSQLSAPEDALPTRAKLRPKPVPSYATHAPAYDALSVQVDTLLQQATQSGWASESDAVLFALLGLLLTPQWHQHPAVQTRLRAANSNQQRLLDVVALLTQDNWAQLSADTANAP
jgi:hypothetical protein